MKNENQFAPKTLCDDFLKVFIDELKQLSKEEREQYFKPVAKRKEYLKMIAPKLAEKLDLEYRQQELLRVDYTLIKKRSKVMGHTIPKVLIESETDDRYIYLELEKLCCINAPLKVLIVYSDVENVNTKASLGANDTHWHYTLNAYHEEKQLIGYTIIMIIKWKADRFNVHYVVYDENVKEVENTINQKSAID